MRILTITNIFPTRQRPSGGSYVLERAAAHRRAGHEVDIVAIRMAPTPELRALLRRSGRDDESGDVPGMSVAEYRTNLVRFVAQHLRPGTPRDTRRVASKVMAAHDVSSYDVIHAHGMFRVPAGSVARELSARTGVPYVVTAHGSDVNMGMPRRAEEFTEAFASARASIFVSPPLMARAQELGAPSVNAHYIPNGVDLKAFTPGEPEREPILLFVGNLAPVKGADRLPAIWSAVERQIPSARLVVIGTGPLRASLEHQMRGMRVEFRGQQPKAEVARAMREAKALLVPSRSEAWGCVIVEAQACGTPVVAPAVGGIPYSLGDGGVLVENDDAVVESLADATMTILQNDRWENEPLRSRAEGFSWDAVAAMEREVLL